MNPPWSSICFILMLWHLRTFKLVLVPLKALPSLIHISWYFILHLLHLFPLSSCLSPLSIRWWGPWMCSTTSWGAALFVSKCKPCCWSGAWSNCTACCSRRATETRPERGFLGWEQICAFYCKLPCDYIFKTEKKISLNNFPSILQVLYKILKSERVAERNKQRIKLKDFGYLGLVCFLDEIPVTMTTVRCLYEQVLATGNNKTALCL